MKRLIITQLLLLALLPLFAQDDVESFDYIEIEQDSTVFRRDVSSNPLRKLQTGVDVNMAYTFSSNGYGGPMFLLSPHVTYPLNNKFSVSAGMSVGYGNFSNPYYGPSSENAMLPMTLMYLYVSGNYHVNDRLSVNGSVYTQIMDVPNRNPGSSKNIYNSLGASFGFQYKITPNISFGAQIRTQEPGLYGPYSPVRNPYGNTGTNWW